MLKINLVFANGENLVVNWKADNMLLSVVESVINIYGAVSAEILSYTI